MKYLSKYVIEKNDPKEQEIMLQALLDQINNQLIGDELALVHIGLGLHAEFCPVLDVCTEYITGRDMGNTILLTDHFSLGAFAGTGCTKHHYLHLQAPFMND